MTGSVHFEVTRNGKRGAACNMRQVGRATTESWQAVDCTVCRRAPEFVSAVMASPEPDVTVLPARTRAATRALLDAVASGGPAATVAEVHARDGSALNVAATLRALHRARAWGLAVASGASDAWSPSAVALAFSAKLHEAENDGG